MFNKLATAIHNTAVAKLAGLRANLKLRDAMARNRGGKLPTIGELHNKIYDTRVKSIGDNYALKGGKRIQEGIQNLANLISGKPLYLSHSAPSPSSPIEIYDTMRRLKDDIYRHAGSIYEDNLIPAASNINKAYTMPEWENSIQYKRLKHLESKIPIQNLKDYKVYNDIPKELLEKLKNTSNAFTDYYYNTFDPVSKRFNYKNLSRQDYANIIQKRLANPEDIDLARITGNLSAANDNYMFISHPRAMGRSKFSDTYKNIYNNYKTQLNNNSQVVLTGEGLDIHGISLNKAIDRYGGNLENALFRGGDTGVDAQAMHSSNPERSARRVKSISQAPAGSYGAGNVLSDLEKGNNGRTIQAGQYYSPYNNQIFFSGIPQVALRYALNNKKGLNAVPFAIGNGKLIRSLSHADAINNSPARYSAETIKNLTSTHPHFATVDLDKINERFNGATKANRSIEDYAKDKVFKGSYRNSNDPSFSQFYETQLPSRALNSPNAYTRGVLVGRNLNPATLGDIENIDSTAINGVNQYKQRLQEELNKGSRDYAFFLPEEVQKYINAVKPASDPFNAVYAMRNTEDQNSLINYLNQVTDSSKASIPGDWIDGLHSDLTVSDIKDFEKLQALFNRTNSLGEPLPPHADLSRLLDLANIDW